EEVDLLEGVAHDLAIPAPDRLVDLVAEDRHARGGGGCGRTLALVAGSRVTRRALLRERPHSGGERRLRLAGLFELSLEAALVAAGGLPLRPAAFHLAPPALLELRAPPRPFA